MGMVIAKGFVQRELRRSTTVAAIVDFPDPGGPLSAIMARFEV